MWSKLDYIHLNPVRAGLVVKASDYIYSSASNSANGESILTIEKADNPVVDVLRNGSFDNYNSY